MCNRFFLANLSQKVIFYSLFQNYMMATRDELKPDSQEAQTEELGPAIEEGEEAGSIILDAGLKEEAQVAKLQAARAREEVAQTSGIMRVHRRVEAAVPPLEDERVSARKQELFDYLEVEGPLRAVLNYKLGTSRESRQKFIDNLRIARAQDEAGKQLDVEMLNILRFLGKVHGKASDVDFASVSGAVVRGMHAPVEAGISEEVFGKPLTKIEKLKAFFSVGIV